MSAPPAGYAQLPSQYPPPGVSGLPPAQPQAQGKLPSISEIGRPEVPPHRYHEFQHSAWPHPSRQSSEQQYPPMPRLPSIEPLIRPALIRTSTHENFAGMPGYPPAMPSRGPKARFTADEDALLKKLKEDYTAPKLSWKQIADFFPDRKSGTLQVRYCTKLRRKDDFQWNQELDIELRQAASSVEAEKWSRISQKLNGKINPTQCQERLETLEAEDLRQQGKEEWEIANQ